MPRLRRRAALFSSLFALLLTTGCLHKTPPGTPWATDIPDNHAEIQYWLDQPDVIHVPARDFDRLWAACQRTCRDFLFQVDRLDYREGVMTTYPAINPQFFEFWRRDNSKLYDTVAASFDTYRRTVRFEIQRLDDDTYSLTPKVVLERKDILNRRVTAVVRYQESLTVNQFGGYREKDEGQPLIPVAFWYAVGRDNNLERRLARDVVKNLR